MDENYVLLEGYRVIIFNLNLVYPILLFGLFNLPQHSSMCRGLRRVLHQIGGQVMNFLIAEIFHYIIGGPYHLKIYTQYLMWVAWSS